MVHGHEAPVPRIGRMVAGIAQHEHVVLFHDIALQGLAIEHDPTAVMRGAVVFIAADQPVVQREIGDIDPQGVALRRHGQWTETVVVPAEVGAVRKHVSRCAGAGAHGFHRNDVLPFPQAVRLDLAQRQFQRTATGREEGERKLKLLPQRLGVRSATQAHEVPVAFALGRCDLLAVHKERARLQLHGITGKTHQSLHQQLPCAQGTVVLHRVAEHHDVPPLEARPHPPALHAHQVSGQQGGVHARVPHGDPPQHEEMQQHQDPQRQPDCLQPLAEMPAYRWMPIVRHGVP